jgi:hypothetical protein
VIEPQFNVDAYFCACTGLHAHTQTHTHTHTHTHLRFKSAARMQITFWGIKNNKLFRPLRDGPARYNATILREENCPNKDSAEWSVLVNFGTVCW